MKIHEKIAAECGLMKANVECGTCGKIKAVNGSDCLAHGWPKCCGYTMKLLPIPAAKPSGKGEL